MSFRLIKSLFAINFDIQKLFRGTSDSEDTRVLVEL